MEIPQIPRLDFELNFHELRDSGSSKDVDVIHSATSMNVADSASISDIARELPLKESSFFSRFDSGDGIAYKGKSLWEGISFLPPGLLSSRKTKGVQTRLPLGEDFVLDGSLVWKGSVRVELDFESRTERFG